MVMVGKPKNKLWYIRPQPRGNPKFKLDNYK